MQNNQNSSIQDKGLEIAKMISNITDIPLDELIYAINTFGIDKTLNNPEIIFIEKDKQQKLTELYQLIKLGGDTNESI